MKQIFEKILLTILQKSYNSQQIRFLRYVPIASENKIKIGHKMTRDLEKKRMSSEYRQLQKQKENAIKTNNRLIIACNKPQFNHYKGQNYGKNFSENCFASIGWRKRYKKNDYFTINSFGQHPAKPDEKNLKSFKELGVDTNIINILETKFKIQNPTQIQILSIEKIRNHLNHNLIVSETGSGKTLAYVIPIIETVLEFKKTYSNKRNWNEPICLIVLPTRELAFQAYNVFKKFLSEKLNFRLVLDLNKDIIAAKEKFLEEKIDSSLLNEIDTPPDIVISIPSRLKEGFREFRNYILPTHLRKLVIDEANLLLDDSNNQSILRIINRLNLHLHSAVENEHLDKEANTQLVFVSATIPRDMKSILQSVLDCSTELDVINTANVNKLMLHVPQKFLRLVGKQRSEKLLEILRNSPNDSTMIFSNKVTTATYVYKFLKENDINACLFYSAMPDDKREEVIEKFMSGECKVMSCTDIASRGLDTIHVKHVINFEIPTFIADYVHRIGRVGRMGSIVLGAKVTNFVSKAYEIDTVWNIERSIRQNSELHNLNANITRIMAHTYKPKLKKSDEEPVVENEEEKIADSNAQ